MASGSTPVAIGDVASARPSSAPSPARSASTTGRAAQAQPPAAPSAGAAPAVRVTKGDRSAVTEYEVAFLVRQYLQDKGFPRACAEMQTEAAELLRPMQGVSQAAKNLEFILNDYIALLEDKAELRAQLRRAEFFALTVGDAVDLYRNGGAGAKGPPLGAAAPGAAVTATAPPAAAAAAAHPAAVAVAADPWQGPSGGVPQGGQSLSAVPPASPAQQRQGAGPLAQPAGAVGAPRAAPGYTHPQAQAQQKAQGAWAQQGYVPAAHGAGPGLHQAQQLGQGASSVPGAFLPQQQQQHQHQQAGQEQVVGVEEKRRELEELQQKIDRESQHLEQLRGLSAQQGQILKQAQPGSRAGANAAAGRGPAGAKRGTGVAAASGPMMGQVEADGSGSPLLPINTNRQMQGYGDEHVSTPAGPAKAASGKKAPGQPRKEPKAKGGRGKAGAGALASAPFSGHATGEYSGPDGARMVDQGYAGTEGLGQNMGVTPGKNGQAWSIPEMQQQQQQQQQQHFHHQGQQQQQQQQQQHPQRGRPKVAVGVRGSKKRLASGGVAGPAGQEAATAGTGSAGGFVALQPAAAAALPSLGGIPVVGAVLSVHQGLTPQGQLNHHQQQQQQERWAQQQPDGPVSRAGAAGVPQGSASSAQQGQQEAEKGGGARSKGIGRMQKGHQNMSRTQEGSTGQGVRQGAGLASTGGALSGAPQEHHAQGAHAESLEVLGEARAEIGRGSEDFWDDEEALPPITGIDTSQLDNLVLFSPIPSCHLENQAGAGTPPGNPRKRALEQSEAAGPGPATKAPRENAQQAGVAEETAGSENSKAQEIASGAGDTRGAPPAPGRSAKRQLIPEVSAAAPAGSTGAPRGAARLVPDTYTEMLMASPGGSVEEGAQGAHQAGGAVGAVPAHSSQKAQWQGPAQGQGKGEEQAQGQGGAGHARVDEGVTQGQEGESQASDTPSTPASTSGAEGSVAEEPGSTQEEDGEEGEEGEGEEGDEEGDGDLGIEVRLEDLLDEAGFMALVSDVLSNDEHLPQRIAEHINSAASAAAAAAGSSGRDGPGGSSHALNGLSNGQGQGSQVDGTQAEGSQAQGIEVHMGDMDVAVDDILASMESDPQISQALGLISSSALFPGALPLPSERGHGGNDSSTAKEP